MDTISFLAVTGFTLFVVALCAGGMYANAHRDKHEENLS